MATPRGVEPPTFPLGGECSILLSYGVFLSQPISRVLSWTIIHLRYLLPNTCSDLPGITTGRRMDSLFGLAPSGVYPAVSVTRNAVRSYRTFSPLPAKAGGLFSVALSVGLRRPGVTRHFALWSPDFPPTRVGDCLAGSGADCTQNRRLHKFLHAGLRVAISAPPASPLPARPKIEDHIEDEDRKYGRCHIQNEHIKHPKCPTAIHRVPELIIKIVNNRPQGRNNTYGENQHHSLDIG